MPKVTITLTDEPNGALTITSDPKAEELGVRYEHDAASPAQIVALMAMTHMAQHTDGMKQEPSPIIVVPSLPKLGIIR